MIATRKELEKEEKRTLAPYALLSAWSRGREFEEQEDESRTLFQRDRDRIIHSKAFRRLSGKTQVFVATYGDHFRDRLSHTLEVAQVARDLARNLKLNEDVCEAVALAHDLGHPPFGHAGQDTLNEIMQEFGSHFEHNEQSKRIVEKLEKQFPNFDGLNLTHEVLQGLAKHQTLYDQQTKKITGKALEAQVVDLADEIAYHNHDLDDGLRSELFTFEDLRHVALWKEAEELMHKKYDRKSKKMDTVVLRHRTVSKLISLMVHDLLKNTDRAIKKYKIKTMKDVLAQPKNIVGFSPRFAKKVSQLRTFLWDNMYQSSRVIALSKKGQAILKRLFVKLYAHPELLPPAFYERIQAPHGEKLEIVVKDYVAGCTDQFATQLEKDL